MYKYVVCIVSVLVVSGSCGDIGRIVGGEEVDIASYPYMASLQLFVEPVYIHNCGASILNSLWVLTAAHCLVYYDSKTADTYDYKPHLLRLVIGSSSIARKAQSRQVRNCSRTFKHPDFTFSGYENDIGMIKVSEAIRFTHTVGVVKIPKKVDPAEDPKPVGKCVLLGWGGTLPTKNMTKNTDPTSVLSPTLLMVELSLSTMSYCKEKISNVIVSHKQICAYSNETKSGCKGDSGGPLICNGEQWGVVFGNKACGEPGLPELFTRVDAYLSWIDKVMAPAPAKKFASSSAGISRTYNVNGLVLFIAAMGFLFKFKLTSNDM